jgi:hypothetical protein
VQQSAWHGDWRIFYTVQSSYNGLTALPSADFLYWGLRLANEPNDPVRDDLGTFPVPGQGAPAYINQKYAFITQNPLVNNGVYVLSQDVDRYKFALTDFADVSFVVPTGVQLNVDKIFPWSYAGNVPQVLQDLGVYKSAWINVHGDTLAATDKFYDLKIYVNWRPMPLDWGEGQDTLDPDGVGGRLVDLVTPDPAAQVTPASRILTKEWAWQHVAGDIDYYDVWILPVQVPPPIHLLTPCDKPGLLKLDAFDMHLQVLDQTGNLVIEGDDAVQLTSLNGQFPSGHVYVRISNKSMQRGAYRLRAEWRDGHYLTIDECAVQQDVQTSIKNFGYPLLNLEALLFPFPFPGPDPEPIIDQMPLFGLGGYKLVSLELGDTFDAIISSAAGQPVIARLYDGDGVLLGEGVVLGEGDINNRVADGHVPQSHLTVGGLQVGAYYLQIVPAFGVSPIGAQPVDVGFNAPAANP